VPPEREAGGVTRLLVALLVAVLAVAAPAAAQIPSTQQSLAAEAATGLQTSPVYVDPEAEEAITPAQERELERLIDVEGADPMYIAVMPDAIEDEFGGSADLALRGIGERLQRAGTYALIAGNSFRAGSTRGVLRDGEAPRIATDALETRADEGSYGILREFVQRVGDARANGGETPSQGPGPEARAGSRCSACSAAAQRCSRSAAGGGAGARRRRRPASCARPRARTSRRSATTSARSTSTSRCRVSTPPRRPTTAAP
jgi:hypothetical protein